MAAPAVPDFLSGYVNKAFDEVAVAGISGMARPAHISIMGNKFTLVDEQGNREPIREFDIEVVVVGGNLHASKVYFGKPYDPNSEDPPLCFSDNGLAPSINAGTPQNPTCQACPKAAWGSDVSKVTGKGIPACQDRKKLAVLFDGRLYQLVIPPNSLDNWRKYAKRVAEHPNMSLNIIRTMVSFAEGIMGTLTFRAVGFAGHDAVAMADGPAKNIAGYTTQKDMVEFIAQHKAKGDKMLDTFTGNDDRPRDAGIAVQAQPAAPRVTQASSFAEAPKAPPKIVTMEPDPPKQAAPAPAQDFMGGDAPAPAKRGPGRPKKDAQPNGQTQAFGMVDTGAAPNEEDPDIEAAMDFMRA